MAASIVYDTAMIQACGRKIRKNRHGAGLLTEIYSNFAG